MPAPAAEAATPGGARTPTTTCSPSASTRARLSEARLAPRRGPPAACSASATREPDGRRGDARVVHLPRDVDDDLGAGRAAGDGAGGRGRGGRTRSVGAAAAPGADAGADPEEAGVAAAERTAGTGGSAVSPPLARAVHQAVSATPATTTATTTARWAPVSRTRPCTVGGSRSWAQPATLAPTPTGRCACRPGPATGAGSTAWAGRAGPSAGRLGGLEGLERLEELAGPVPVPGHRGIHRVGTDRGELGAQQLQPPPCHLGDVFLGGPA